MGDWSSSIYSTFTLKKMVPEGQKTITNKLITCKTIHACVSTKLNIIPLDWVRVSIATNSLLIILEICLRKKYSPKSGNHNNKELGDHIQDYSML